MCDQLSLYQAIRLQSALRYSARMDPFGSPSHLLPSGLNVVLYLTSGGGGVAFTLQNSGHGTPPFLSS